MFRAQQARISGRKKKCSLAKKIGSSSISAIFKGISYKAYTLLKILVASLVW